MSRSNNEEVKNPATRFFEWNADKDGGFFEWFDKEDKSEAAPKGRKKQVALPFKFVVLDVLSTIAGFHKGDKCGIYSNEVKDLKTQSMNVKTFKKTEIATGLYEAIKDRVKASGGKFAASVYIGFYVAEKGISRLVIGHIKMVGSSVSAWIEYGKSNSFYSGAIEVSNFQEAVNGNTTYRMPVFKQVPVAEVTEKYAKELDVELQEYLKKYFARNNQQNIEKEVEKTFEHTINDAPQEKEEDYNQEPVDERHVQGKIEPNKKPELIYDNASTNQPGTEDAPF